MSEQAPTGVRRHAARFGFPFPPLAGGSEQAAEDTPAVAGPDQAPGTAQEQPQVDWEKRYQDLQPEYTRTSQEAAQLREAKELYDLALTSDDPDTRRQALEALGYEIPADEDPEPAEYEDPYEELRTRTERVEQQLTQRDQETREQQEASLIREIVDEQFSQIPDLAQEDQDMVLAYAINALPPKREPGVPVPIPDIQGAVEHFRAREEARMKTWAKTKRSPYVSPGGQTATEVPLPRDATHDQRVAHGLQKWQEANDSQ